MPSGALHPEQFPPRRGSDLGAQQAAGIDERLLGVARQVGSVLDLEFDGQAAGVAHVAQGGDDGGQVDLAPADADGPRADVVLEYGPRTDAGRSGG